MMIKQRTTSKTLRIRLKRLLALVFKISRKSGISLRTLCGVAVLFHIVQNNFTVLTYNLLYIVKNVLVEGYLEYRLQNRFIQ